LEPAGPRSERLLTGATRTAFRNAFALETFWHAGSCTGRAPGRRTRTPATWCWSGRGRRCIRAPDAQGASCSAGAADRTFGPMSWGWPRKAGRCCAPPTNCVIYRRLVIDALPAGQSAVFLACLRPLLTGWKRRRALQRAGQRQFVFFAGGTRLRLQEMSLAVRPTAASRGARAGQHHFLIVPVQPVVPITVATQEVIHGHEEITAGLTQHEGTGEVVTHRRWLCPHEHSGPWSSADWSYGPRNDGLRRVSRSAHEMQLPGPIMDRVPPVWTGPFQVLRRPIAQRAFRRRGAPAFRQTTAKAPPIQSHTTREA